MQVVIVGGGPAGLYLAVLLRLVDPSGEVVVLERHGPDDTRGSGLAFPEHTLARLHAADPATYDRIAQRFERWDHLDVYVGGRCIRSGGHGFSGISRQALVHILAERADALGAEIRYHQTVDDETTLDALGLGGAEIVVAADGAASTLRTAHADQFGPYLDERPLRYLSFETTRRFPGTTYAFVENAHGVFQAQAFPFDEQHSTFIVQCDPASWQRAGFDRLDADAAVQACEALFAPWLDGHALTLNVDDRTQPWQRFTRVTNDRWHNGRVVLLGDAAHTTHYALGVGCRVAMEDALSLALALAENGADDAAFAIYEAERKAEALRLQNAAENVMEWFENVGRYIRLPGEQFAYALITRSQGVSHEGLRARDRSFLERVERRIAHVDPTPNDFADVVDDGTTPPPPMFTPLRLRELTLPNRVVVAPMDLYRAEDGTPNDFHLIHFGARALGGAGLLMTEMTCVAADARLSPGSVGLYRPDHVDAWRRITDAVHRWSPSRICLQLGHAGPKGSTKLLWEGNEEPLDEGGWDIIAPSAVPFRPEMQVPRAMTRADMDRVRDEFVQATHLAIAADFDMIEVQCAHGMLLSAFITPLSNHRGDEYGGSLENRLRYPLEVFAAVRAAWPEDRPMSVCISAADWVDGGVDATDGVAIARAFHDAGVDIVQVAAGNTSPEARPVYARMFQTPLSDRVRNEAGVRTIAVGNITDAGQVNAIIAAGRADLCALGRPHLTNPHWTLHAAADPLYAGQWWPAPYERGRQQLERELQRRVDMLEADVVSA